jgi:Protein of unknown function (DUF1761)
MTAASTQGGVLMSGSVALSIVVATVAAFVLSFVWYMVFGGRLAALSPAYAADTARASGTAAVLELLRSLVLAAVVAVLAAEVGADTWLEGAGLGLLAWVGFPLVLLTGSVLHERYPWRLAAIHLGDWLLKLLLVAAIVSAWR